MVPVIGPLIVTALTTGFVLLLNAVGSIVSFVAIKRGYGRLRHPQNCKALACRRA